LGRSMRDLICMLNTRPQAGLETVTGSGPAARRRPRRALRPRHTANRFHRARAPCTARGAAAGGLAAPLVWEPPDMMSGRDTVAADSHRNLLCLGADRRPDSPAADALVRAPGTALEQGGDQTGRLAAVPQVQPYSLQQAADVGGRGGGAPAGTRQGFDGLSPVARGNRRTGWEVVTDEPAIWQAFSRAVPAGPPSGKARTGTRVRLAWATLPAPRR
jgi:hypothetical protein